MTVYVVGGLSVDHLVNWQEGAKFYSLGGPALYAACGVRAVDKNSEVEVLSIIPESEPRFISEFQSRNIGYASCERIELGDVIWICTDKSGRVLFPAAQKGGTELLNVDNVRLATSDPTATDYGVTFTRDDFVLLSSPKFIPPAYSQAGTILIDPDQTEVLKRGWSYFEQLTLDAGSARMILLPSRVQLTALGEISDPVREIHDRFGIEVVARLDHDGMDVLTHEGRFLVRDQEVPVKDTTGAGDTTAGAILGSLASGRSLKEATELAVSVARILLSDWGIQALTADIHIERPLTTLLRTERD